MPHAATRASIDSRYLREHLAALLAPACFAYYLFIANDGHFVLARSGAGSLLFNDMLRHLLAGQFDVDPAVIGNEAFVLHGRSYAYFGILPAFLRLPLLLIPGGMDLDMTPLSCALAAAVAATAKISATLVVIRSVKPSRINWIAGTALILSFALGGAQVQYLHATFYQEVALWAGAFSAVFVRTTVPCLIRECGFTASRLAVMSVAAGLALLTRVTPGVGLYAALGLLFAVRLLTPGASIPARLRAVMPACAVLATFAVCVAGVNYARWDNPFVFMPMQYNTLYTMNPPPQLDRYGYFHLGRIWFGALYYFFPLWVLRGPDGHALFHEFQNEWLAGLELPPGSFLLSDALLILLSLIFIAGLFRPARSVTIMRAPALAVMAGLAIPPLLLMSMFYLSFRYRTEFYPLLELGALLGLRMIGASPSHRPRLLTGLVVATTLLGLIGAHATWALYRISPLGPTTPYVEAGIVQSYVSFVGIYAPRLAAQLRGAGNPAAPGQ